HVQMKPILDETRRHTERLDHTESGERRGCDIHTGYAFHGTRGGVEGLRCQRDTMVLHRPRYIDQQADRGIDLDFFVDRLEHTTVAHADTREMATRKPASTGTHRDLAIGECLHLTYQSHAQLSGHRKRLGHVVARGHQR